MGRNSHLLVLVSCCTDRFWNMLTLTDDSCWLNPAPLSPKIYPSGPFRASWSTSAAEEGDIVFDANNSSFYLGGEEASIQKKAPQVKKRLGRVMCTKHYGSMIVICFSDLWIIINSSSHVEREKPSQRVAVILNGGIYIF
ncbi:hypothetical protein Tco_0653065 [Tanacetum coccineum]|uniref:Uncharacterized protein n=1 Tax=Tanacetum coccineum TaxID=301880 RepID=A0ABQ4WZD4_9ASTR